MAKYLISLDIFDPVAIEADTPALARQEAFWMYPTAHITGTELIEETNKEEQHDAEV